MKPLFWALLCLCVSLVSAQESKARFHYYEVTVTNISRGQGFSPPLVVSHQENYDLFTPGEAASPGLTVLAEDGNALPLKEEALMSGLALDAAVADGILEPGQSVTLKVKVARGYDHLTVLGMLVTSNDGFFAADKIRVPTSFYRLKKKQAPIRVLADVWDSGTEANTEDCDHIPIPCGNFGVRHPEGAEGYVHVHNGIHGHGDLDKSQYDWRNPLALITVKAVD